MPAPAQISNRSRCTDVIRVMHATAIDVAIAGDRAALIVYELGGITRILIPLDRFIEGCRGAKDCNGNPIPSLTGRRKLEEDAAEARVMHEDLRPSPGADAARRAFTPPALDDGDKPLPKIAIASTPPDPTASAPFQDLVPKRERKKPAPAGVYQRAWDRLVKDPTMTCAAAVLAEGGSEAGFSVWISKRGLSVKRLRAESRLPIEKPSGGLL